MSKLDKDTVIAKFTEAYQKVNGSAPSIEAKGGWYSVNGEKNIRLAQLEEQANDLLGGAPSAGSEAPKEAPKATKKAAPAKKSSPKKTTSKAKSKSSFSVKDFYTQQITAVNPGAKAPR